MTIGKNKKSIGIQKLIEKKDPKYLEIFADKIDKKNFPYDETLIKHGVRS